MRQNKYAQGGTPLAMQAGGTHWPTPTALDRPRSPETMAKSAAFRKRNANQDTVPLYLGEVAQNWPTPAARDHKQFDGAKKKKPSRPRELYLSIRQDQATTPDGHACSHKCLRLNPLFVSYLMGLPPQWPDDSAPLATQSFRQWEALLGSYLVARKEGMLD